MTQHPLGPIDWAKVDPASAIAAVQTNDLRDPDRQAAYQEITNRWNAHEQMLEALDAARAYDNHLIEHVCEGPCNERSTLWARQRVKSVDAYKALGQQGELGRFKASAAEGEQE